MVVGGSTPSLAGTPGTNRLKLILKVGGSSTPEHSDSPGPSTSVVNVGYDEDSQQSNTSVSQMSHSKKSKKKEKKSKKEKKHKHRHKVGLPSQNKITLVNLMISEHVKRKV